MDCRKINYGLFPNNSLITCWLFIDLFL
uniref:Uncharacterized protein n=1 Tax=Arundo donax TaxID=35708 RepID=A0A0A9BQ18_ARUDO